MKKRILAVALSLAMALGMTACGGSSDSGSASSDGKVSFTIFNSKTEIQEYLEEAAAKYAEENDVNIEVYYSNDTVSAHLATKYAANDPYTLNMVDAKDVYSLGPMYGLDLSDQEWVGDTDYAISVEDEQVHQALSEGQDAFQFGGCWEWNDIVDFDYTGNIGIMPVPQNIQDDYTGKIVGGGSKYFYVDNSENTTPEQQQAAKDFLNWLVSSDDGKTLISDTCAMVSPFKSNTVPCANDIGAIVKQYVDSGNMVANYDYDPDDHYSVLGAVMQKYLADQIDRAGLAKEIQDYWANVTPVEH